VILSVSTRARRILEAKRSVIELYDEMEGVLPVVRTGEKSWAVPAWRAVCRYQRHGGVIMPRDHDVKVAVKLAYALHVRGGNEGTHAGRASMVIQSLKRWP